MISRTIRTRPLRNVLFRVVVGLVVFAGIVGCINRGGGTGSSFSVGQDAADLAWANGADQPAEANTLVAMARLVASQGRDEQARFTLARVIHEHPGCLTAYVELAELHLRHRRVNAAQDVLRRGLAVAPRDPVLLNDLGMCWLLRKDYDRALKQFAMAAAAGPDNARYRANLALALGMAGRYDECLAAYEQVLHPADAHYNLAVICDSRNDTERAVAEYARALRLSAPAETTVSDESAELPEPDEQLTCDEPPQPDEQADLLARADQPDQLSPQDSPSARPRPLFELRDRKRGLRERVASLVASIHLQPALRFLRHDLVGLVSRVDVVELPD